MDTASVYEKKPWLKHYLAGVPSTIAYEETCLPEFLERVAQRYPARMALNFQGYEISYAQLNATAMYQYTGGTTGVSKGVILTHDNLSKQGQQIASLKPGVKDDQVVIGALPFFHVLGLTMALN